MKASPSYMYSPARTAVMRWFTNPGANVPAHLHSTLLGELYTTPGAVFMGVFATLVVPGYALYCHGGAIFLSITILDVALSLARIIVARHVSQAALRGRPVPTDFALLIALLWCCTQGAMAFTAMRSGEPSLQVLAGTTIVGLTGPICARNYAAPRWALLLISITYFPFVIGAVSTGEAWTRLILLQCGPFILGSLAVFQRFQTLAIANLMARHESQYLAVHDALTGLLNRAGLMEALDGLDQDPLSPFTLFYLDLDGFKGINDRLGHEAGDRVLREVAARIQTRTSAADIVGRLGGDEFVIARPGLQLSDAPILAEALIRSISRPYDLDPHGVIDLGVSIGFACYPEDACCLTDLHRMADSALYASKRAGRGMQQRFTTQDRPRSHNGSARIALSAA